LNGLVKGLHHITLVTLNEEVNRRFYTEVLGLRRVKLTVNQDDIFHRHLFYADEKGNTGSAITFFEWPDLPEGRVGSGSPHHLAYNAPRIEALPRWTSWLRTNRVPVLGPLVRGGRASVYLRDPDGVVIEIAVPDDSASKGYLEESLRNPPAVDRITADMRLSTFNHVSPLTSDSALTAKFLEKFVGLESGPPTPNTDEASATVTPIGNDEFPDFLRYLGFPHVPDGLVGAGSVHHIAMAVEEDEDQVKLMRKLDEVGVGNSGIIDRFWFKSLYFRDPDGNLLEVATKGPGYTADEPIQSLGSRLVLPKWIEPKRVEIERHLEETDTRNKQSWPPKYPALASLPEAISTGRPRGS